MSLEIILDGEHLSLEQVQQVAHGAAVVLSAAAHEKMRVAHASLERAVASGKALYGVNTGFGPFARQRIEAAQIEALQVNLIRSHAVGFGAPVPIPAARAMLLLRAHSLSHGWSGVGPGLGQALVDLLNHDIVPVIPEMGSVGASGDLAPLAHVGLALLGEGDVFHAGVRQPASAALRAAGLQPHRLRMKEGLALINGTQYMTAFGVLGVLDAQLVLHAATITAAMSIEALLGTTAAFHPQLHRVRRHQGQRAVAHNLRLLLQDSAIVASHRNCDAVQDAYSLRCTPQILGACQDAIVHVRGVMQQETDAVTDNPLVIPETGEVISGGNFHGEPVALALDHLGLAVCEIGSVAERRLYNLLYNNDVEALPYCLTSNPGLQSGLMIVQYLAASLVSENRSLSHPATLDNVVTGGGAEDHNSMGSIAALRLPRQLRNVRGVLAAELLAAAQALEFHAPLQPGTATAAALACVRRVVPRTDVDRSHTDDIERLAQTTFLQELVTSVEAACGATLHTQVDSPT
jgi:histidine ammonia-lyase